MKATALLPGRFSLLLFIISHTVTHAWAQGYVRFNNQVVGQVVAPVYGADLGNPTVVRTGNTPAGFPPGASSYDGPLLAGSGYTAQLWAGPVGTPANSLTLVATTIFRTGSGAGFVVEPTGPVTVPGVAPGGQAAFQVRVWKNQNDALQTWNQMAGSLTPRGASDVFVETLGTSAATVLRGWRSFNITCLSCGSRPFNITVSGMGDVVQGETVRFNVQAFGEPPVTYSWFYGGNLIPGATNTSFSGQDSFSYSITNVQASHAGVYEVGVSNNYGGFLVPIVSLRVFPPPSLESPTVTPQGNFSLVLTGAPNRRYAIELATNLPVWQAHRTVTNVTGRVEMAETNGVTDAPWRFYRARVLP